MHSAALQRRVKDLLSVLSKLRRHRVRAMAEIRHSQSSHTRSFIFHFPHWTITHKRSIKPYWERLASCNWDHKLIRKLFTDVINQVRNRVISSFPAMQSCVLYSSQLRCPLPDMRENTGLKLLYAGFAAQTKEQHPLFNSLRTELVCLLGCKDIWTWSREALSVRVLSSGSLDHVPIFIFSVLLNTRSTLLRRREQTYDSLILQSPNAPCFCPYKSILSISFIHPRSSLPSLLPSSAAHFYAGGMVAATSIIHFPSEQVVFALQGAAGENREGEGERLKTRKNEEWSRNGWRLWIEGKNESKRKNTAKEKARGE